MSDDGIELFDEQDEDDDIWECSDCEFEGVGEVSVWRHLMRNEVIEGGLFSRKSVDSQLSAAFSLPAL